MSAPAQAPLFYDCPLPGCENPTDHPAQPCGECLAMFGPRLRPTGTEVTAEQAVAEYAERDAEVAAAYAMQRDIARWSA